MIGPVVCCGPVLSDVLLIGQAPGPHEGELGRPFAWTAGKNLFRWFQELGIEEDHFRSSVYMSAVCRCFPGKTAGGADRVPDDGEIASCSRWLEQEFSLLRPKLVIPVGRIAIGLFLSADALADVVGTQFTVHRFGIRFDCIPLPHPSGASTWHRTHPRLLRRALGLIGRHQSFRRLSAREGYSTGTFAAGGAAGGASAARGARQT